VQRDVPFWTPPRSARPLLCDVWRPPAGVPPSGLAFILFHGSAWVILDKDVGTRPFFRHLAAQGHVIMDVAYRLYRETDIEGMVGDVRRSVAWLKANALAYGVNPDRIVIGGGSAGGHIALLAAYTEGHPELTPPDTRGVDTSVPARYALLSPITQARAGCPPTLMMQGPKDIIAPLAPAQEMRGMLERAGVKAALLVLPQVDHGFDLIAPTWSPSARMSLWHAERFLALMAA